MKKKKTKLERKYGRDYGVKADDKLCEYFDKIGYGSLAKMIKGK